MIMSYLKVYFDCAIFDLLLLSMQVATKCSDYVQLFYVLVYMNPAVV